MNSLKEIDYPNCETGLLKPRKTTKIIFGCAPGVITPRQRAGPQNSPQTMELFNTLLVMFWLAAFAFFIMGDF
jgi:hypothetical protein